MSRTDVVVEQFKTMITSGRFVPGQKLPTEDELAAELRVSRSALREAVRALTFAHILRTRQGDGTYVTTLEPELLFESLGSMMDLVDEATLVELYQVRRILEPAAAALATARVGTDDIERLEQCIDRMAAAEQPDDFIDADIEFHHVLVSAAGNAVLTAMNGLLATRSVRARLWRAREEVRATHDAVVVHREIVAALQEHDADLVRAVCASHIADGERWLRSASSRAEASAAES